MTGSPSMFSGFCVNAKGRYGDSTAYQAGAALSPISAEQTIERGLREGKPLNVLEGGGQLALTLWPGAGRAAKEALSRVARLPEGRAVLRRGGEVFRKLRRSLRKTPTTPALRISDRQFGAKVGRHAPEFGLDPADAADRAKFLRIVEDIGRRPDRVIPGTFRGQARGARGPVSFRIKGRDVVVTSPEGEFVTILKNGVENPSVRGALRE